MLQNDLCVPIKGVNIMDSVDLNLDSECLPAFMNQGWIINNYFAGEGKFSLKRGWISNFFFQYSWMISMT